mmetsp:Transcript_35506/g.81971  ORF Transcript_35506/g.81971 Transcript_35506/m.81971 type:complete len:206 (-) Transcript_35506:381-998(-)
MHVEGPFKQDHWPPGIRQKLPYTPNSLLVIALQKCMALIGVEVRLVDHLHPKERIPSLRSAHIFRHGRDGLQGHLLVRLRHEEALVLTVLFDHGPTVDLAVLRARKSMQIKENLDSVLLGIAESSIQVRPILLGRSQPVEILQPLAHGIPARGHFWPFVAGIRDKIPISHRQPANIHAVSRHVLEVLFADRVVEPLQHVLLRLRP